MPKLIINLIAHDGITSFYTGVGRVVQDSINILCQKLIYFADYDYTVNAVTGKYNQKCLGFDERIKSITKRKLKATGGDLYECSNGSGGDVSYGDISNWEVASSSAAAIIDNIAKNNRDALCINLCLDTPFANVANYYYSRHKAGNNIFIWIPHSTVLIHKIDSAITFYSDYFKKRFEWEKRSVNFVNANERIYLGYVGKFMKRHLIKDYGVNGKKLIDFTNGLDLSDFRYQSRVSQEEIGRSLRKISIPTDKKILFSFGRLEPSKGFDHTIRIGGLLTKIGYQTVLMAQPYTKKDPLIAEYQRLFQKHNPTGIFIYDYPFDLPHKIMGWKNTRILLVPSIAEPFGLIPEEARLYKNHNMAIVAANSGGLAEQINDEIDGFLVDIENLEKSYKKILEITAMSSKKIKEISIRGHKRAELNYDLRKNITKSIKEVLNCEKKIDIIIKSWNAVEYTLLSLSSIRNNTKVPYKITIVDDGSNKNSLKILRSLKDVRLIEHGVNRGPARAALTGFKNTKSRIVVLMDNDVVVSEDWLEHILPYFNKRKVAIVAPLKFNNAYKYPGAKQSSREVWENIKEKKLSPAKALKAFTNNETLLNFGKKLAKYNALKDREVIAPPGFVSGCCIAVNRESIIKAGGITRSIFESYGGEDVDLCWRVGELGFKIIKTAEVYVHHFEHASVTEGECNYQKTMEENNKLLYNLWGKKILTKEVELLKKMSTFELKRQYPFIPIFKEIKKGKKVRLF